MSSEEQQMDVAEQYVSVCHQKSQIKNVKDKQIDSKPKKLTLGLTNYKSIKSAHLKNFLGSQIDKENQKQYTFKPKLTKNINVQKPHKVRSFKKFIKDQQAFLQKRQEKIEKKRSLINKTEADQLTCRPAIDRTSNRIVSQLAINGSYEQVFDRLTKEKQVISNPLQQTLFSPKILMRSKELNRKENVCELLYSDAQRRISKEKFISNQLNQKRDIIPTINRNANKLMKKKVYAQYLEYVEEEYVPPIIAITTLSEIFNVDLNPNKSQEKEYLCQHILKFILNDNQQFVQSKRLWSFIEIIIDCIDDNNLFNENQIDLIYSNFSYFYINRLAKQRKIVVQQRPTFKPTTLYKSNQLAGKHRERVLTQINEFIETQNIKVNAQQFKIQDLFIVDYLKKKVSNEKKKREKENQELKQCSFRPKLNDTHNSSYSRRVTLKRQQPTTNQNHRNSQQPNQNHRNSQYTHGTADSHLVPKPSINHPPRPTKQKRVSSSKSLMEVKNMDKTLLRMSLGRKNRQFTKMSMDRGYPKEENWGQFQKKIKQEVSQTIQTSKGYNMDYHNN